MSRRLQFAFQYVASPRDKKTSIVAITSIRTEDNKEYVLPQEMRFVSEHEELMKTDVYKRVKKSFTQRGQDRTVWITLTKEMEQTYFDKEGNIMFNDLYLEQIIKIDIVEPTQKKESQLNLKHIAEKFMIEKFTSKHSNAKQWLETFEKECKRLEINEDNTKIEILRLFLDKSCSDWHSATLTILTMEAGWSEWKKRFLESFADKEWSTGIYAIYYRYKEGSLIEYAMRKEKLLLDMDNDISQKTLVLLIAAGLPEFVRNKIDKENCKNSTELLHEIRKCENLVNKNSFAKKKEDRYDNKKRLEGKQPCKNCESLNKGTRYHPEDSCWFKKKERNEGRVIGSNSVIEVNLNTEEKNEKSHH
ncbi:uncharacterized protein [Polyergus mexicanus]|uniref:uncharacterized protein n=1 Tax=Polyergus mexicanus TaxID=615972 RepID=UPI0038B5B264